MQTQSMASKHEVEMCCFLTADFWKKVFVILLLFFFVRSSSFKVE